MNLIGPPNAYTDILYHAVKEEGKLPSKWGKSFPLRPSSSGQCTRELAFKMMEFLGKADYNVEKLEPRIRMLFDLGNAIEYNLIKWFRKCSDWFMGKYNQQTVEFYRLEAKGFPDLEYLIEGSLDQCFWSDKYKCVIDYKSKGDKWSTAFKSKWKEDDDKLARISFKFSDTGYYVDDLPAFLRRLKDPYFEANFLQLNGYLNTEFMKKRGVDHGAIIQYNKNDSSIREIRFRPSAELFLKVRDKFQTALDSAASGKPELAPRDFNLGSVKCAFCPFKQQCWPESNAQKEFFKTLNKFFPRDLSRLNDEELTELFETKEILEEYSEELKDVNELIVKKLINAKTYKVKLDNGHVYNLKYLKTPRKRHELRRGKI